MSFTLNCQDCGTHFDVAKLDDAWPWCPKCKKVRDDKKRRAREPGTGGEGTALERQFAWGIEHLDDAAVLRGYVRNFVFDVKRLWEFDFAWPERRLAVELQGGQWTFGRHTRGGHEYRDELAKHRAAAIQGWLVLCYTTDDITGKTKGIPALVETAAVYRSRPTIGPDGILPHVVAWEAAGRALAALIDSEAVPADRVSKCLAAWRGVRSILEAGGGDGPKCSDAANPQKHKRGAI
mgnify:FL=1